MLKSDIATRTATMLAPVSVRLRKIENEISGWLERSSMATNAAISPRATAIRPSVWDEPQPTLTASTSA